MKTTKILLIVCSIAVATQLISCKKNAATIVTANSSDLSVQTVSRANLIAWYKFKNGSTGDYSGNNNHLTAYNVTKTSDYLGRPNNAYYFNGSSSYLEAANSNSLNPTTITMAALIKPMGYYVGNGVQTRILMKGIDDQSNGAYFLGFDNTGLAYGTFGDNQYQSNGVGSASNVIQLNNWYKMVYTYDGTVGKLFINGILVNKVKKTASFNANTSPLRIGVTGRFDYPYWFNGVIDEIRIYNVALNSNQVSKLSDEIGQ